MALFKPPISRYRLKLVLPAAGLLLAGLVLLSASWAVSRQEARRLLQTSQSPPARAGFSQAPIFRSGLPWRVGIQAGHWQIQELPAELRRLRASTGAKYGELTEADLNLRIARRLQGYLEAAGIRVDLLSATVPPRYRADAFVSIHADGAYRPGARGWKISAPWRVSQASRRLREAVASTYPYFTGLPEDRYGITYNMRGYYAFSYYRFRHAIAPSTPAIIIETGFITVAEDREILYGRTDRVAWGIAAGIIAYLSEHEPYDPSSLLPRSYPIMRVITDGTALYHYPGEKERVAGRLSAGTFVIPLNRERDWLEIVVWGNYRKFGWVALAEVRNGEQELDTMRYRQPGRS